MMINSIYMNSCSKLRVESDREGKKSERREGEGQRKKREREKEKLVRQYIRSNLIKVTGE